MKENKEFKSNANYFNKGEALKFIGIGLMVLAGIMYFFGWGYISYILMSIGLPLGAVLLVVSTFGRSTESDIDNYIKKHTEGVEHKTDDQRKFEKRLHNKISIQTFEGYDYSEGLMYKKGKNGQVRSSKYCKAVIYPLETGLCICYRKISLVSDEIENLDTEMPYTSITVFEMKSEDKNLTVGKNSIRVKETLLMIGNTDGTVLSLPIKDSIMIEEYLKKISALIERAKEA